MACLVAEATDIQKQVFEIYERGVPNPSDNLSAHAEINSFTEINPLSISFFNLSIFSLI